MSEVIQLRRPWLVAVWPGMGNVALNAGVYLLAKLGMTMIAEIAAGDLFDVEHVEVKDGILSLGRRPRSRLFAWHNPQQERDLVVFLGEAQPPLGKYAFCRQLVEYAKQVGVQRVLTFAAMATAMHPEHPSRVFAAATDEKTRDELKSHELELLEDGHIGGLNGVLLGVAAEQGLHGGCLLGEMPHIFHQLPFPKASLAILKVFTSIAAIDLDFSELAEQANVTERQLGELLERVQQAYGDEVAGDEEGYATAAEQQSGTGNEEQEHIERLFSAAAADRAKAFELKQELDRLGLFKDYEDRFLDLFKKTE